jgi:hydroxymethylpyrimidine pyrophosphatase-like HAD family hydrolase
MLRTAFFGFAMRNGSTTAKLSARYLTENTNEHDGVAIELKRFFDL